MDDLLTELAATRDELATAEERVTEIQGRRDDIIRRALAASIRPKAVAEASGVKTARLYQIRDGRR